jgi:hypothetical protein
MVFSGNYGMCPKRFNVGKFMGSLEATALENQLCLKSYLELQSPVKVLSCCEGVLALYSKSALVFTWN